MTCNLAAAPLQTVALPVLSVVVAGTGNVGAEFLSLLPRQQQRLANQLQLQLAGVFNSRQALLAPDLDSKDWQHALANASSYQQANLLAYLAKLPAPKVLVDITPSQDFARQYPAFIAAGCHIISANKQGVTLPGAEYQAILAALQSQQLSWLSNTTVGAGIPVQRVLQELQQSGDQIRQISGVFSGTLSWLLCRYDGSKPFSEFVLEAQALGYTEPDPRDDLSGKDVQRKLLVLARELTLPLELADIELAPLLPAGAELGNWQDFWAQRAALDAWLLAKYQQAAAEGKVLRYAACLSLQPNRVQASVQLVAVASNDPLAALAPCDNMFVIESEWYQQNPLVLKGPGAGRAVTAGGLHADLAVLAHSVILSSRGRQSPN
ncbi:aspartate kinase [Alishewanella longhuensis]